MSDFYLDLWLQHLPEAARPEARDHARNLTLSHPNLAAAATVLGTGEPRMGVLARP